MSFNEKSLFVPFKTKEEWIAFLTNAPADIINFDHCARPEVKTITPAPTIISALGNTLKCNSPSPVSESTQTETENFLAYARTGTIKTKSWTFECTDDLGNKWDQIVEGKFTALDADEYATNGKYWKEEYTYSGSGCESTGGFAGDLIILLDLSNSISDNELRLAKTFINNLTSRLMLAAPPAVPGQPYPPMGTGRVKVAKFASCDIGTTRVRDVIEQTSFFTKNNLYALPAAIGGRVYTGIYTPCRYTNIGDALSSNYYNYQKIYRSNPRLRNCTYYNYRYYCNVQESDIGNSKTYLIISDGKQTVYPYKYTGEASRLLHGGTRIIAVDIDSASDLRYITSTEFNSEGVNNSYYQLRYSDLTPKIAADLANSTCSETTINPLSTSTLKPRTVTICGICDGHEEDKNIPGTDCYNCWHGDAFGGE